MAAMIVAAMAVVHAVAGEMSWRPLELAFGTTQPAMGMPTQEPWLHVELVKQAASGQLTPVILTSAGHVADLPVHFSAASHGPVVFLHTYVVGLNAHPVQQGPFGHLQLSEPDPRHVSLTSVGHCAEVPVHVSSGSQAPVLARQTVLPSLYVVVGQLAAVPEQCVSRSQAPLAVRHTTVLSLKLSAGHAGEVPVQFSATSQTWVARLHVEPPGRYTSGGQVVELPVQYSGESQLPEAARHTVDELRKLQPSQQDVLVVQEHCTWARTETGQ
jgi:hypothetical protein